MNKRTIGFYPIVDSFEWLSKLILLGVPSIQLRIKNKPLDFIEADIIKSVALAKANHCQLFINDYWELAIKHGAFGVHLGQEDLDTANCQQLHDTQIRLGISTHNGSEINRALQYDPFYIAYGPIYHTNTKPMTHTPRGLNRLMYWVDAINLPIVAIGGIGLEQLDGVIKTGVDGVSVISAISNASDYSSVVKEFMTALALKNQTEPA